MRCPYCISEIDDAALACPHCARDLYLFKPLGRSTSGSGGAGGGGRRAHAALE
jgi:hypothetical protein